MIQVSHAHQLINNDDALYFYTDSLNHGTIAGVVVSILVVLCIATLLITVVAILIYKTKKPSEIRHSAMPSSLEELHIYEEPEDLADAPSMNPFSPGYEGYEIIRNDSPIDLAIKSSSELEMAPDVMTENDAYNAVNIDVFSKAGKEEVKQSEHKVDRNTDVQIEGTIILKKQDDIQHHSMKE